MARFLVFLFIVLSLVFCIPALGQCPSSTNPVVAENCLPGAPQSEWDISGAGDPSIQGYATDISVNKGETVHFKVNTPATSYRLDIYRLGYYAGNGARLVATVSPTAALPQIQPDCLSDAATGLVDCGNWTESASWAVPAGARLLLWVTTVQGQKDKAFQDFSSALGKVFPKGRECGSEVKHPAYVSAANAGMNRP